VVVGPDVDAFVDSGVGEFADAGAGRVAGAGVDVGVVTGTESSKS